MPRYKIVKIYVVDGESRIEARNTFNRAVANNKEDEYLESITIREIEPEANKTGWTNGFKDQIGQLIVGTNSKR